ncbi:MAG TPA: acetate kinase [Candidatus Acidoferrum sp.]|nr:acetate kinase [Candidatus Acidoferrum sp.]
MKILVLNSGSSSQKSCLYDIGKTLPEHPPAPAWEGKIEWGGSQADVQVRNSQGAQLKDRLRVASRSNALEKLLDTLWSGNLRAVVAPSEIDVVGHRIVHGGKDLDEATLITPQVKSAIARMSVFAPLHNRAELEGIELIEKHFGKVAQVAVFDTGFHARLPDAAAVYPGPYEWLTQGIRRYGFHGINHQYCAERTAQLLGKDLRSLKLVTCHLGNGCSLAAIRDGRSVDTTMGFTPLEGLMMGTRSGSLDPGILTYLMRQGQLTGQQLDDLLNTKSGLLGISGISGDMRQIVTAMKDGHPRAKLAFEIFVHRLQAGIGAMIAVLGGIDALVFTAGIGENSPEVRAMACANFGFLGLKLNATKNAQPSADQDISLSDSSVRVLTIRAQEDWAIARDCWRLILASQGQARAI